MEDMVFHFPSLTLLFSVLHYLNTPCCVLCPMILIHLNGRVSSSWEGGKSADMSKTSVCYIFCVA